MQRVESPQRRHPLMALLTHGADLALLGLLGLFLLVDLATGANAGTSLGLLAPMAAAVTVAAVALRRGHLEVAALAAALCSIGVTVVGFDYDLYPSVAETAGLLILTPIVARLVPRPQVLGLLTLLGMAVVGEGLRRGVREPGVLFVLGVLFAVAVAAGLYLRWLDIQRVRAASDARRDERLDLARELHDLVAHYVTGIVVQAQAGQVVVDQQPAVARDALAQIERAGADALAAMRRMVGSLRSEHDPAIPPPVGSSGLEELVAQHNALGLPVRLDLSGLDTTTLPAPVAASIHRIVLESLTNVRRHAVDVTVVDVIGRRDGDVAEIDVRDDGRQVVRHAVSPGGFGIVGMTERALALGGSLTAGPRDGGAGWQVLARLPLDGLEGVA